MIQSMNEIRTVRTMIITLVCAITLSSVLTTDTVLAKGSGEEEDRAEFYGIIQARPEKGMQGTWVVGNRTVTAGAATEFDQSEGQLTVGSCAKVHLRNGRVHEIDSEPMRNCR